MKQQQVIQQKQKIRQKTAQHIRKSQVPAQVQDHPYLQAQGIIGNHGMLRRNSDVIQAKLKVSSLGDKYEQEADRVAEQVMRMPEPGLQRQSEEEEAEGLIQTRPIAGQITPLIQRQEENEEELIQPKTVSGRRAEVTPDVRAQINAMKGGGHPLPESTRAFFEQGFGYDFSLVRVHTGASAQSAARALDARAFTVGKDIVFEAKEYAPKTSKGRQLIAHELTHVTQQAGSSRIMRQIPKRLRTKKYKGTDKYADLAGQFHSWLSRHDRILYELKIVASLRRLSKSEMTRVERAYGQPRKKRDEWNPYRLRDDIEARLPNGKRIARWIRENSELKPRLSEKQKKVIMARLIEKKAQELWPENKWKATLSLLNKPSLWPKRTNRSTGDIILGEDFKIVKEIQFWGPWVVKYFKHLYKKGVVTEELSKELKKRHGDLVLIWKVRTKVWGQWTNINRLSVQPTVIYKPFLPSEKRGALIAAKRAIPSMEKYRLLFDETPSPLSNYMIKLVNTRIRQLKKTIKEIEGLK